jgi:hypothetical protein
MTQGHGAIKGIAGFRVSSRKWSLGGFVVFSLLTASLLLNGCAGVVKGTAATGNGQATLTVTPTSASFGSVAEGAPTTQTIQLSNTGTGTLSITQVKVTGSGFSTSAVGLPISLNAGQASNFNVQFSPASAGAVSGSVDIVSNAPNSPAVIPLSGTGVASTLALSFSTTNLAFGNVNSGTSSTLPVTVTNKGNANVQLSKISESGAAFTLTNASMPVTLTPSQSLTFDVIFSPPAAGSDSGTVAVSSNATGSPTSITLSGTGVAASGHAVTLSWTASTSTVSGYNMYRSTTNGSGYAKINTSLINGLSYTDASAQIGTTYYYVATAVDGSGRESGDSNQATAVIP